MNQQTQTAEFQVWEMTTKGRGESTLRLRTPSPSAAQRKAEAIISTPLNYIYIMFWPAGHNPTPSTVWDSLNGWHCAADLRSTIRHLLRTG